MAVVSSVTNPSLSPTGVMYDKILLKRLVAKTVYYNLAYKRTLERGKGRTYTWNVGQVQSGDTTVLAEGQPVDPISATATPITAQVQEYGNVIASSSLLNGTDVVETEKFIREQIEQKGAYTVDQLLRNEVFGSASTFGTNLFAANLKTSIASLVSTDVFTLNEARLLTSKLEQNNVPTFRDGKYACVISVGQKYDLTNSNSGGGYLDLAKQNPAGISEIKKSKDITDDGEVNSVGEYGGLVLFATTLNPVVSNGTVNVTYAAAFGDESLGAVELEDEKFKIFKKDGSNSGIWDTIEMIALAMGYKTAFAAKNLSENLTDSTKQRVVVMGSATSLF